MVPKKEAAIIRTTAEQNNNRRNCSEKDHRRDRFGWRQCFAVHPIHRAFYESMNHQANTDNSLRAIDASEDDQIFCC
jgi:hypothetical protein